MCQNLKEGSPNCLHVWRWSCELFTTAPMKQHRACKKCGRSECVTVCDDKILMSECSRPSCPNHPGRKPAKEPGTPAYALRNGLLVPRSIIPIYDS